MILFTSNKKEFYFQCSFYEKDIPKSLNFFWLPNEKLWCTSNIEKARMLIDYADDFTQKVLSGAIYTKKVYTDGFSNKNKSGYLVTDSSGSILYEYFSPFKITCNVAELSGMLKASEIVAKEGLILSDSKLAVNMATKQWGGKDKNLISIANEANNLIKFKKLQVVWISRQHNIAGKLASRARYQ